MWCVLVQVGVNRHCTSSFPVFLWFPVLSLCFPICSLTAKTASTSNLRQNAFSIMNYAQCWMRTKLCECFYLLVTFFSLLCILIWSTVKSQTPLFALSRYDACTAWTLCCCLWKCNSVIVPIRDYLMSYNLIVWHYNTTAFYGLLCSCCRPVHNPFAWLLALVNSVCCSCFCQWSVDWF